MNLFYAFKNDWSPAPSIDACTYFMQETKKSDTEYVVTVCFTISQEGKADDIYIYKSVEWSADAEVIQLIDKSPQWTPAFQHGKNVRYRQMQNITYVVN